MIKSKRKKTSLYFNIISLIQLIWQRKKIITNITKNGSFQYMRSHLEMILQKINESQSFGITRKIFLVIIKHYRVVAPYNIDEYQNQQKIYFEEWEKNGVRETEVKVGDYFMFVNEGSVRKLDYIEPNRGIKLDYKGYNVYPSDMLEKEDQYLIKITKVEIEEEDIEIDGVETVTNYYHFEAREFNETNGGSVNVARLSKNFTDEDVKKFEKDSKDCKIKNLELRKMSAEFDVKRTKETLEKVTIELEELKK